MPKKTERAGRWFPLLPSLNHEHPSKPCRSGKEAEAIWVPGGRAGLGGRPVKQEDFSGPTHGR